MRSRQVWPAAAVSGSRAVAAPGPGSITRRYSAPLAAAAANPAGADSQTAASAGAVSAQ